MIVDFFRWWGNELASLVPGFLREPSGPRFPVLEIALSSTELVLRRVAKSRREELGRFERRSPDAIARDRVLRAIDQTFDPRKTGIAVRLPVEHALARQVELPSAARENLHEVLSFEIHRLTPFKVDNVYFDGHVVDAPRGGQTLRVAIVVVPRAPVDEALASLSHWPAVAATRVDIALEGRDVRITFAPPRASSRRFARLGPWLLAANVTLLAIAVGLPLHEQHQQLMRLRAEAREAEAAAEAARSVEERLEGVRSELEFLAGSKNERPAVIEVFDDLSARIPDTTWLNRLEIQRDEVRIAGFSESASALIATLEESALFTDPRFISPVTRDTALGAGVERFFLSARIVSPAHD